MKKYVHPISILILGSVVAVLHALASAYFFYYRFAWYDIIMHFLGGALVSLFFYYVFHNHIRKDGISYSRLWLIANMLIFLFIIGFLWESFELKFGTTFISDENYVSDTIYDFVMNSLGGISAYVYVIKMGFFDAHE